LENKKEETMCQGNEKMHSSISFFPEKMEKGGKINGNWVGKLN
jgi:hypothetical protein